MTYTQIDFNHIIYSGIKEGISINETLQLASLCKLTEGVTIRIDSNILNSLINKGYLDDMSNVLPKGFRVFKGLKMGNIELARQLRSMYPSGMKDDKWPWRGTVSSIAERLDDFNRMYPDISNEEIIITTKDYLDKFNDDNGSRSLLAYFIWKMVDGTKRSILAEWAYAKKENKVINKPKSNIDQL